MSEGGSGTVFVLGARSFIGGHLCRALIKNGYDVILHSTSSTYFDNLLNVLPHPQVKVVKCLYTDVDKLKEYLNEAQFAIYSTPSPGKQTLGQDHKRKQEYEEFLSLLNILKASPNIKRSVFVSTCSTIKPVPGLADETCVAEKPFGWAVMKFKLKLEQAVVEYIREGLPMVIVNPTMYVGEYDSRPSSGEYFKFINQAPFLFLKGIRMNIVDIEAAAQGMVLALKKGKIGERYILSGENIYFEDLVARIKGLAGKRMPIITIPTSVSVMGAFFTEILNLLLRQPKPLVPMVGIEIKIFGTQHFSCEKAKRELGYDPRDAWAAVDRGFRWYKEQGLF